MTQFTRFMRPATRAIVAGAAVLTLAASSLLADVSDHIPSDALVVIKINDLQAVSNDAGMLAREFGAAEMVGPQVTDPIGLLQEQTGIRQGLRNDGDMAIYIANGNLDGDEPPMVILVPITDFAAFSGNFQNLQDSDVDGVQVGQTQGEDVYMVDLGDFAAISPKAEFLLPGGPENGMSFSGVSGEVIDERDIVLYANFKQIGPMLTQALEEENVKEQAREEMMNELESDENAQQFSGVANAVLNQGFGVFESFLRDAEAAEITLDLSEDGIGLGVIAQFKPDSYLANIFGNLQATDDSLLDGLPEGAYLVYGGSVADREANTKLFNDLLGPIIEELEGIEGSELFREYVDVIRTQVTASGDARFGMLAPQGQLGNVSLVQQVLIQGGDVDALVQSQRRAAELTPQLMGMFANLAGEEMPEGMALPELEYTQGAKTVAGVEFDKLRTTMGGDEAAAMEMQMQFIFGPEGQTSYLGRTNDKLMVVSGLSDTQIASVVEAVEGGNDQLADLPGLEVVNRNLPSSRSAVLYLAPDELIRSGIEIARPFVGNVAIQLPDNLPPVGMAWGPDTDSLRGDLFISKDLISALIVAGLQAQQQMGGDNGPGGGL